MDDKNNFNITTTKKLHNKLLVILEIKINLVDTENKNTNYI
jgi:hypothetical protein